MSRGSRNPVPLSLWPLLVLAVLATVDAFGVGVSSRPFVFSPKAQDKPKLILISGCTGTGKSTFGMSVALDQGILKCISTDTVRAVMRSFIGDDISPALHRSSYTPAGAGDDPVRSWRETCTVLEASVEGLVEDAINRGTSLVVEGVHVVPSRELIDKWENSGGVAIGCLLTVPDADAHKALLLKRGKMTGKDKAEQKKLLAFGHVRAIQDEMMRLAQESDWLMIKQKLEPDPLEMVAAKLLDDICMAPNIPPVPESHKSALVAKHHEANDVDVVAEDDEGVEDAEVEEASFETEEVDEEVDKEVDIEI